jgi:hypothetical protein
VPSPSDDRIQQLCKEAVDAKTPTELDRVIPELRAALEEHIRRAKKRLKEQRNSIAVRDAAARERERDPPPE